MARDSALDVNSKDLKGFSWDTSGNSRILNFVGRRFGSVEKSIVDCNAIIHVPSGSASSKPSPRIHMYLDSFVMARSRLSGITFLNLIWSSTSSRWLLTGGAKDVWKQSATPRKLTTVATIHGAGRRRFIVWKLLAIPFFSRFAGSLGSD